VNEVFIKLYGEVGWDTIQFSRPIYGVLVTDADKDELQRIPCRNSPILANCLWQSVEKLIKVCSGVCVRQRRQQGHAKAASKLTYAVFQVANSTACGTTARVAGALKFHSRQCSHWCCRGNTLFIGVAVICSYVSKYCSCSMTSISSVTDRQLAQAAHPR
jgi:hypothetical protein